MQPQQPPQQFCLRWNNYQSNLTNVFDQLLQSESFVDVTLACEGHSVKAHKMVLSACSPYFQALFFDNPCQHPIVILKDIKWPELKAAVEFMYKGEINVSQEQIGPLLKVAESLKIRGLADVGGGGSGGGGGGDPETNGSSPPHGHGGDAAGSPPSTPLPHHLHSNSGGKKPWDLSDGGGCLSPPLPLLQRAKKRRRPSGERSSVSSPEESDLLDDMPLPTQAPSHGPTLVPDPGLPLPPPPPPPPPPQHPEDLEIKPGIAEMIREEERVSGDDAECAGTGHSEDLAKLLESSHAWLGASTSSIAADSYQYQLQSMWQKCWNTNQSLVHNLRFRERGPLKSWRPETMAEAIFSVLREGLSLSQAARKYDIPYPTFVLYANRVHNMLGPSIDGGADLRPKGRGRPQRILLGSWPEEHINGVIRAVVFRDPQHIKEEPHLSYPRLTQHTPARRSPLPTNLVSRYVSSPLAMSGFGQHIKDDPDMTYPHMGMQEPMQNYGNMNAPPPCTNGPEPTVSPGAAAAAAVAVVAQGLRQQMCSMVAAAAHHQHTGASAEAAGLVSSLGLCLPPPPASNGGVIRGSPLVSSDSPSPPHAPSPLANSLGVGIGLPSSMSYKPPPSFTSPRPETLFQEDIEEIVKSPQVGGSPENLIKDPKETPISIKMESVVEAQNE